MSSIKRKAKGVLFYALCATQIPSLHGISSLAAPMHLRFGLFLDVEAPPNRLLMKLIALQNPFSLC